MINQIHWQLFLRVTTEEKVNRILTQITERGQIAIREIHRERYWKDRSLFHIRLVSPIAAEQSAEAVLETLQTCSQLADQWTVGPPQIYEGGEWEFSGSADSSTIKIPGLTYVDFQAGNIPIGKREGVRVDVSSKH